MKNMFFDSKFDGDISKWDVSNVTDMSYMFYASKFDRDISEWDVSNVIDMSHMFYYSDFNRDINNWDVSNITNMSYMFYNCTILEEYKPKKQIFKEQYNFINKLTKEECCISYEKININNDYMICNTCIKQYLFENINEWLKIQNTCPHCRENWTSNTIYINK
jgi:surface protein